MGRSFAPDKDIPDLSGQVILVTGGNTGLGKETILQLAKHRPAHIYMGARNGTKADQAIREIHETLATQSDSAASSQTMISFLRIDLSSLKSVEGAVSTLLSQEDRLDLLINNAGIFSATNPMTTDGYESVFGTNHVGHALLTRLLLPTMEHTAGEHGTDARVIFVSSGAEAWSPPYKSALPRVKTDWAAQPTYKKYGLSKAANLHYAKALAVRHPSLRVIGIHPGPALTGLGDNYFANCHDSILSMIKKCASLIMPSPEAAAHNQLWAATSSEAKTGVFYHPVGRAGKGSKASESETRVEELWTWTEEELKPYLMDAKEVS